MEPFSTLLYLPHLGLIGRSSMSWLNQARESPSFTEHYVFLLLISLPTNKKRTLRVLCVFSRLSNGESPKPNPSCADGRRWSKSDGTRTRWFWFESNETESTISFYILLAPKPPLYRTQGGAYINGFTLKWTNLPNVNMSKRRVYPGTHHLTTPKHCMHLHLLVLEYQWFFSSLYHLFSSAPCFAWNQPMKGDYSLLPTWPLKKRVI